MKALLTGNPEAEPATEESMKESSLPLKRSAEGIATLIPSGSRKGISASLRVYAYQKCVTIDVNGGLKSILRMATSSDHEKKCVFFSTVRKFYRLLMF